MGSAGMKRHGNLTVPAILAAGLFAGGTAAAEPEYVACVRKALDGTLARTYADPDRWLKADRLHCVANAAACQVRLWRLTGRDKYADEAARLLGAIAAYHGPPQRDSFFAMWPMIYACRELTRAGRLSREVREAFRGRVVEWFVAREYADHNRSLCRAAGLELAAQTFPDLPQAKGWHEYAAKIWDLWYAHRDITENAPNYNQIDLVYVFVLADALGRTERLKDPAVRAMYERFRDQVTPSGTIPAYGDSGSGQDDPNWPIRNDWGYWPAAFERAAALYGDGTFRWAAEAIFRAGSAHEPLGGHYGHIQPLHHLALAAEWRDESLRATPPAGGSAILTRREPGNDRAPDKLILRPSREAGSPMVLCDLYARSHHAHVNQHGGIAWFEHDGVPLLHMLGYNNRAPEHVSLLMVRPAGETFPHRVPHFTPDRWYEAELPTCRMPPVEEGAHLRRIDGVTLRVASRGVRLWADGLRLVGPAGEIALDDLDAPGGWRLGPQPTEDRKQGAAALTWQLPGGVVFVGNPAIRRTFDCTRYTHFKLWWKLSDNREFARPLIFRCGVDYHAQAIQLQPRLLDAKVDARGGDQFGRMAFDGWFTHDTRHTRRMVLTREGVLVVLDELLPGPAAAGRAAGPIWHFGPTREPVCGADWFASTGARVNLLVRFDHAAGRTFGVQTADVWGKKAQRTAFAKETLRAGEPVTFASVLVPCRRGTDPRLLAGGILVQTEGTSAVASVVIGNATVRVALRPDGEGWRVSR